MSTPKQPQRALLCGGWWLGTARNLRPAYHINSKPHFHRFDMGFRIKLRRLL